jgi:hypothetical protein
MEIFDILTYDYDKVNNLPVTTTDPDWTTALELTTPQRMPGTYKATFSLQFTLNSTSQSFLYRFSTDGGSTWGPVYQKEVKDRSNTEILEVLRLVEITSAAPIQVSVQVTREGSADCEVVEAFISVERVK